MAHEAWINRNWEAEGITWVVVARARGGGDFSVGAFLIDAWCLGVKDAYADEMSRGELDDLLDHQIAAAGREAFPPADAKRLIEGAVVYAQQLGFLPHRDFRKARKVLNGIDATMATREFTYGCEGKPRFIVGPYDDDARVNRVLAVLTAKLGEDGFVVEEIEESDADDEGDDATDWDAIDMCFRYLESPHCPVPGLSRFFASGFVAAAIIIDPEGEIDPWWTTLLQEEEPELPDNNAFAPERILDGFLEIWEDIEGALAGFRFVPGLPPLEEPDHFSAAAQFCRGFLSALETRPAAGATIERLAQGAEALATVRRVATSGGAGPEGASRLDQRPIIAVAVLTIHAAMQS